MSFLRWRATDIEVHLRALVSFELLEQRRLLHADSDVFLNVGGGEYVDHSDRTWAADHHFDGGVARDNLFPVAGTKNDALYSSRRFGESFSYAIPLDAGIYSAKFYFLEPAYEQAGKRRFDVFAEGNKLVSDLDLAAEAGLRAAYSREVFVGVSDGELNLRFEGIVENAIVSAIRIKLANNAAPPTAPIDFKALSVRPTQVDLSWGSSSGNETFFELERKMVGVTKYKQIVRLSAGVTSHVDSNLVPNTLYRYRVRASNAIGDSEYSDSIDVSTAAPSASNGFNWEAKEPAPLRRAEAAGAVVNGKLYVFGGFYDLDQHSTPAVHVYDPDADKWERVSDMPISQTHAQAEVIDDEIWLAGSMIGDRDGKPSKQVWIYNPKKDEWRKGVPLPAARGAGGFVKRGAYVHFFGGQNKDHEDAATHWRLKIDGGKKWQKRAPLPNPRNHVGNVTLDRKIYAIGGQHDLEQERATADVHVYLTKQDRWKKVASLPEPLHHIGPSIIATNGRIIVAGGQSGDKKNRDTVIAYDPKKDEWEELGELPGERKSVILGAVGKLLILTAGNNPAPSRSTFVGFLDDSLFT